MNDIECETCVKRKTMFCPNSIKCYATKDKPFWQNRIMLLEEKQQLQFQLKQKEKQLNDIKDYIKNHGYPNENVKRYNHCVFTGSTKELLSIIERNNSNE